MIIKHIIAQYKNIAARMTFHILNESEHMAAKDEEKFCNCFQQLTLDY